MPLFTRPQPEDSITHLAEPINVPEPISRRVLNAALANYYGADLSLEVEGFNLSDVSVCNLSDTDASGTTWAHTPPKTPVAIDPVLGRISFQDAQAEPPRVMFHYGFSTEMGGGEYERTPTFDAALGPVDAVASPDPIQAALDGRVSGGVVELSDSGRFEETPSIALDPGVRLEFRAKNEHRPTLILAGPFDIGGGENAEVTLNGLLIAGGRLRIVSGAGNGLRKLRLVHCTLVPGLSLGRDGQPTDPEEPSLVIEQDERPLEIEIDHSIVGALRVPANATVLIRHSIVDANAGDHVAYAALNGDDAGGTLSVVNSTIIGTVEHRTAETRFQQHLFRADRRRDGARSLGAAPDWLRPFLLAAADRARPAALSLPARSRNRGAGGGGDQAIRRRRDQRCATGRDPGRGRALAGAFLHVVRLRRSRLWPAPPQRPGADPRRGGRRGGDGRLSRSFSAATRE